MSVAEGDAKEALPALGRSEAKTQRHVAPAPAPGRWLLGVPSIGLDSCRCDLHLHPFRLVSLFFRIIWEPGEGKSSGIKGFEGIRQQSGEAQAIP